VNDEERARLDDVLQTEKKKTVARIIAAFTKSYEEYLWKHGLRDTPIIRVGYYQTAFWVTTREPILDKDVQRSVLTYLVECQRDHVFLSDMEEHMKKIFVDTMTA
jgi:hypothetical protein